MYKGRRYQMSYANNVASLTITDSEPNDSGKYRCEGYNGVGRVQTENTLTVHSK